MYTKSPIKKNTTETDTVVVSFRAPRALLNDLDEIAKGDDRTRANFIVRTLSQAVSLEPAIQTVEQILPRLLEEHKKDPDSMQAEFWRGVMSGARWMLMSFFNKRAVRWVNQRVRDKTNLPIPHVVPMQVDGSRYGFDTEADLM
jgi:hypothetical protein